MTNALKIAIDPGFNALKGAVITNGEMTTDQLPSAVGLAAETSNGLDLGIDSPRRGTLPLHISFDGHDYLVGHNVHLYTEPIYRMDFDRFTDSPELRASVYALLSRLITPEDKNISLALSLPVPVVQNRANAKRVERDIQSWMLGPHQWTINGTAWGVEIHNLKANIAQPVAAWMDWGFNEQGEWVRGKQALKAPTMIIDMGFNTLDILVISGAKISTRFSGGDQLGVRRICERLMGNLQRQYGISLDLMEANDFIVDVSRGKEALAYVGGQPTDITSNVNQAIRTHASDVLNWMSRGDRNIIKEANSHMVSLVGGGSIILAPAFIRSIPHAQLVDDPVFAGAMGLVKTAQRKGVL